jgi:hypothetical protein
LKLCFRACLLFIAFPTIFLIGDVVMKNWKTVCYAGAGYLMCENGQYEDLNLKVARWLSTRHEFAEKAITCRMIVEINGSGHYVVQIEVCNDKCFRASGWTADMLGKWINDEITQKEIFGS